MTQKRQLKFAPYHSVRKGHSILLLGILLLAAAGCASAVQTTNEVSAILTPTPKITSSSADQAIHDAGNDEICTFDLTTELKSVSDEDRRTLSTPELIQLAVDNGEITSEQRLVYLAYAIYNPSALPTQFQSDVGWYGTIYVKELYQVVTSEAKMCKLSVCAQRELRRLIDKAITCDD